MDLDADMMRETMKAALHLPIHRGLVARFLATADVALFVPLSVLNHHLYGGRIPFSALVVVGVEPFSYNSN